MPCRVAADEPFAVLRERERSDGCIGALREHCGCAERPHFGRKTPENDRSAVASSRKPIFVFAHLHRVDEIAFTLLGGGAVPLPQRRTVDVLDLHALITRLHHHGATLTEQPYVARFPRQL